MNLKLQLKILSFLQFCLWGSWLTTLGSYMFVTLKFDGACGEVIVSACVDHCREKHAKPYGTRLWAGQAVSARLVGK